MSQVKVSVKSDKGQLLPWSCGMCTFVNMPDSPVCQMCTATNPKIVESVDDPSLSDDYITCNICSTSCNIFAGACVKCGADLFEQAAEETVSKTKQPTKVTELPKAETIPTKIEEPVPNPVKIKEPIEVKKPNPNPEVEDKEAKIFLDQIFKPYEEVISETKVKKEPIAKKVEPEKKKQQVQIQQIPKKPVDAADQQFADMASMADMFVETQPTLPVKVEQQFVEEPDTGMHLDLIFGGSEVQRETKAPIRRRPEIKRKSKHESKMQEIKLAPSKSMEQAFILCNSCKVKNPITQTSCKGCKQSLFDQPQKPTLIETLPGLCLNCTYQNLPEAKLCQLCNSDLVSMKFMIFCPLCTMMNHKTNTNCIACEKPLPETEYNKKVFEECPICMSILDIDLFQRHLADCKESQRILDQLKEKQEVELLSEDCPYCGTPFVKFEFEQHLLICEKHPEYYTKPELFGRLDPLQVDVIKFMHQNSCKLHFSARIPLQKKLSKLGYTVDDLHKLYKYIYNEVPLIVHIHVSKHMQFFVKDTHYRNQFETGKSSGSTNLTSRSSWQTRMFFKKYDKADKTLKVKYGTVNFTNDPKGVNACRSYGNSYLLLKKQVRERCTVTDQDSSNTNSLIGTFKFCYHILNRLSDAELKATMRAANGEKVSSSVIGTYKEIQIHGPLEFSKDFEKMFVNENEYKTPEQKELVENFSKQFGVPFEVFHP